MIKNYVLTILVVLLSGCSSSDDDTNLDPEIDGPIAGGETSVPTSGGGGAGPDVSVGPSIPIEGTDDTGLDSGTVDSVDTSSSSLLGALQLESTPERVGLVTISDVTEFSDISAFGVFLNWPSTSGTDLSVLFGPDAVISGDTCAVTEIDFENDLDTLDILQDDFELISAGESITLTSDAGTYGSLELNELLDDDVVYFPPSDLPFPSPIDLSIGISGAEFLATTVLTEKPQPIEGFSIPLDTALQEFQSLLWDESSLNGTFISITLIDANPNPQYTAECLLIDDGEFVFPTSLQTDVTAITGNTPAINISEVSRVILGLSNDGLPTDALIYSRSVGLQEN